MEDKQLTDIEVKAQVFDILAAQDFYRMKINDLEELKKQKLQQLQEIQKKAAESEKPEDKKE